MCELFSYTSSQPQKINDLLREFYADGNSHPHGWGLSIRSAQEASLEKEPVNACESCYLQKRLADPIITSCAIAHIRYATIGDICYNNCNPFIGTDARGTQWLFGHNGTMLQLDDVRPYLAKRTGETDSEAILLYLLDVINKAKSNQGQASGNNQQLFTALDKAVATLSKGNKLNLLFNDGLYTYAHINFLKQRLYQQVKNEELLICTRPLSKEKTWEQLPFAQLLVYRQEKLVYSGEPHGNIYLEKEEDFKHLYQEYAML